MQKRKLKQIHQLNLTRHLLIKTLKTKLLRSNKKLDGEYLICLLSMIFVKTSMLETNGQRKRCQITLKKHLHTHFKLIQIQLELFFIIQVTLIKKDNGNVLMTQLPLRKCLTLPQRLIYMVISRSIKILTIPANLAIMQRNGARKIQRKIEMMTFLSLFK